MTDKAYNKKAELTFTIDKTAPTVTGVEDGAYYHEDVTPIIEDENLQNVVVKYNGKKLTSYKLGDTLTKEGTYQIRVTDKAGNKFDYITFTIDKTAPVVTGATNGGYYRKDVTLTITEENIQDAKYQYNGKWYSFESGHTFTEEGTYFVRVTDKAYNKKAELTFTIDKTAPTVTGATNGGYYRKDVTLTITEENIQDAKYQYNGKWYSFESGHIFTEEGTYFVRVTDKAYNKKAELTFTIDKTAPTVTGVEDGAYYHEDVTPIIEDENLQNVVVKYNGKKLTSYKLGDTLTKEGTYQIRVTDKAGNKFDYITFIIDKTPASRVYSTLDFDKSGKQYYENDGEKVYYVKNGDSFTFRMQFSEALKTAPTVKVGGMVVPMTLNEKFLNNEGKYIYEGTVNITQEAKLTQGRLEIVLSNVIDLAGNESTDEVVLNQTPTSNGRVVVYDVTSPGPTILGITGFFNENEDAHYITYGKKVRVLTYYKEKLSVNPVVKIGNKEFETYYTEDSSDLKNGVYAYYADITITEDLGLNEGEIPFTVSGHKDLAGNEGREYTNADITYDENDKYENRFNKVVLDNTNPSISIEGTTGEKYWFREQTFNVVVTEANLDNIYYAWNQSSNDKNMHNILDSDKATKVESKDIIDNGDGTYTVKITIAKEGRYVLNVKAVDKAGNSTYTRKGWYQIDRTAPVIDVVDKNRYNIEINTPYVERGYKAYDSVDGDITDKVTMSYLFLPRGSGNWQPVKTVDTSLLGTYKITYQVSDRAGNAAKGTRSFEIVDTTAPVITLNGANEVNVEFGSEYKDEGVTIIDNSNEEITPELKIYYSKTGEDGTWTDAKDNKVDTSVLGQYKIWYTAKDSSSNASQVTRIVKVVDTTAPVYRALGIYGGKHYNNTWYVINGDKVYINVQFNEKLAVSPYVKINGKEAFQYGEPVEQETAEGEKYYIYSKVYTVNETDGKLNFEIYGYADAEGNVGETLTAEDTTVGSQNGNIIVDTTAPTITVDQLLNGVTDDGNVTVKDANDFEVVVKYNTVEKVRSTASVSKRFNISWLGEGNFEVIATDMAGNTATASFELDLLDLTAQAVGSNLIDEVQNTINNFNAFAIKFDRDLTFKVGSDNQKYIIEMEYSTDGVNYTKSSYKYDNQYQGLNDGNGNKYGSGYFSYTIPANSSIHWNGTSVGSRWTDIYEAIKATKDTENKVYVRAVFTVVQPSFTKSFTLDPVVYSKGGYEVTPRGLPQI